MKFVFAIIVLLHVQVIATVVGMSSNKPTTSSPNNSNEASNQKASNERPTAYHRRKQLKIAQLEKVGVETNVATAMVTKYLSGYHSNWMKANKEKGLRMKRESYQRRYSIVKDKSNERRKQRYHERKATEPNFMNSRRKTTQDRYEANVRSNVKKGMTQAQAIEEAGKYMHTYRMKASQSLQQRRQEAKQKAAQHHSLTSLTEDHV